MTLSFEEFKAEWLCDVQSGNPNTLELGRRFARKLLMQAMDIDSETAQDDLILCDGSGDGGIDIAFLDRRDSDDEAHQGHKWYLVQGKYGTSFDGTDTLLAEGKKVVDTLSGLRSNLSSLANGLLQRIITFRQNASEHDRLMLTFATVDPLSDEERQTLQDIRAMGHNRLGGMFDVEALSVHNIYTRFLEQENIHQKIKVPFQANVHSSDESVLVGTISLLKLYDFLKAYRDQTEDLTQLYEKNVRQFLSNKRKVNKGIQSTLRESPERFGLFNNGITIVVSGYNQMPDDSVELIDPYIVNGCQTTRSIWDVFQQKLESGATGETPDFQDWRERAGKGVVVCKVVQVGEQGEELLKDITRYTNSQNAIQEKDFLALDTGFKTWADKMADKYGVFLEIQRGGWDAQRALQRQNPDLRQFSECANAFDLLKVYGAGWMAEPGVAFGKNSPFLPDGAIFRRLTSNGDDEQPLDVDDLYAAYRLQRAADGYRFGRSAQEASRRQTRFLFYFIVVELLKDVLTRSEIEANAKNCTDALLKLVQPENEPAAKALFDTAIEVVDTYLTNSTDMCVFREPMFVSKFNHDLNAFLKWDRLGKSEEHCPRFSFLLSSMTMVMNMTGQPTRRELIASAIRNG